MGYAATTLETGHLAECCPKVRQILAIFRNYFALFFCYVGALNAQSVENGITIDLSSTSFSIERPFTISVVIQNSTDRPTITFPAIAGFVKRGLSTGVTTAEIGDKSVVSQVISQRYEAQAPGRYVLPPFALSVNGTVVRSEGAVLLVRPAAGSVSAAPAAPPAGTAFLALRSSRRSVYAGEGVGLTLSFFVADTYPYELDFPALDQQLQAIAKQIRPANAWEENVPLGPLKPVVVPIGGKPFREYRLYQSIFFPMTAQPLQLPAVSLNVLRRKPAAVAPARSGATPPALAETVVFSSPPHTILIRPLPPHPLRGRVPVGTFQLEEQVVPEQVGVGQSVHYAFTVTGTGNVAALPAPVGDATPGLDVFPPQDRFVANRSGSRITGYKTFAYYLVPHEHGLRSLANRFQWIYFDPQTARYDTLRSARQLRVGDYAPSSAPPDQVTDASAGAVAASGRSIYAGIEAQDSRHQPFNAMMLVRAVANVLIVLMLLGTLVLFFRK